MDAPVAEDNWSLQRRLLSYRLSDLHGMAACGHWETLASQPKS